MSTIIKSLLIVMAVAVVAGGATYSYFSDTAIVSGNTFAAGTLNIEAGGQNCHEHMQWYDNDRRDWRDDGCDNDGYHRFGNQKTRCENHPVCNGSTTFEVKNAQPGNCATDKFTIKNTGTLTARDFVASWTKGSDPLCEHLIVTPESLAGVIVAPGHSKEISVEVCFNDSGSDQSDLQGRTCAFDLNAQAKAYDSTGGAPEALPHN